MRDNVDGTHLRIGYTKRVPKESGIRQKDLDDPLAENDRSELGIPDDLLILQRRRVTEVVYFLGQATERKSDLGQSKRPSTVPSKIERGREGLIVGTPELIRMRGEEGRELRVEEIAKIRVSALSKHEPEIFV